MDWVVIMAGGGGTRLWPLSRRRRPKQFLRLAGDDTLLGATVARTLALTPLERTLVVTAAAQVGEVRSALPALPADNVVVEPEGRNTAACIGLACVAALSRDPHAILGVLPSDQHVADGAGFVAALREAFAAARSAVVTIGIPPTRPETGFGYLQAAPGTGPRPVLRFVEKPDRETAARYVAAGDYRWNAGMFFFPAARMLAEIRTHLPALADVLDAIAADPACTAEAYPRAPRISIDYAVMEKLPAAGGLLTVDGDFGWSDVGSWDAVADARVADGAGNTVLGDVIALDAADNVLVSSGPLVAVVGVSGLVVVADGNAVLVLPRERAQDVRAVVEALQTQKRDAYL